MSAQRYERISHTAEDDDEDYSPSQQTQNHSSPSSPPPSFRSRASSITHSAHNNDPEREHLVSSADRTLAETFDTPSDDDSDDETTHLDDRQRVMSGRSQPASSTPSNIERRVTHIPAPTPASTTRVYGGGNAAHDGVFANMSAKPQPGDDADEKPPTYEQAAADATPPYWEHTILAPYSLSPTSPSSSNDVFIDGLPVGSLFSFVWNGMISMSFQLVGFLLTYLLHTTHAAKNGAKAGLGITLIQYGFGMRRDFSKEGSSPPLPTDPAGQDEFVSPPQDPNNHDIGDAGAAAASAAAAFVQGGADGGDPAPAGGIKATDWLAYALMIVGWFVLVRSMAEYVRARRHEQLVLQSPSRGLNVAVVGEEESAEGAV